MQACQLRGADSLRARGDTRNAAPKVTTSLVQQLSHAADDESAAQEPADAASAWAWAVCSFAAPDAAQPGPVHELQQQHTVWPHKTAALTAAVAAAVTKLHYDAA